MTSDDSFMVVAGVRYCLGRHSYAPSLCCDWLRRMWPKVDARDRRQIVYEIEKHIADEDLSQTRTWEVDLGTWRDFVAWAAKQPADAASADEEASGHRQLSEENRRLRKALQPFACAAEFWEIASQTDEGQQILVKPGEGFAAALTVRDFRRARAEIRGEGER